MFSFWRCVTTALAALLAVVVGLGATLLITPATAENLRALVSTLLNEEAPAVMRNLLDAIGAARDAITPG